jgi:hypothetical protein
MAGTRSKKNKQLEVGLEADFVRLGLEIEDTEFAYSFSEVLRSTFSALWSASLAFKIASRPSPFFLSW